MGAAEDAYEQRRLVREYTEKIARESRIVEAKRRLPGVHAKALVNLKRHHYPDNLNVRSRMLRVNGRRRVGWELVMPFVGSTDRNLDPEPGIYLLGEGEIVMYDPPSEGKVIRSRDLGNYIPEVVRSLERMASYPYEPERRPLWHRILR